MRNSFNNSSSSGLGPGPTLIRQSTTNKELYSKREHNLSSSQLGIIPEEQKRSSKFSKTNESSMMFFSNLKSDSSNSHINPPFPGRALGYPSSYTEKSYLAGGYPISINSIGGTAGAANFYRRIY